jgi:hypothetical protein
LSRHGFKASDLRRGANVGPAPCLKASNVQRSWVGLARLNPLASKYADTAIMEQPKQLNEAGPTSEKIE